MLEEQIEYFRGNRQEIENEKQRKRELILHFSNILGTVDKTRYVLQDDEKPNTGNHYGERDVSAPTLAVISNEGEKSKEQQDALAVGVPGFENNAKTVNFDSWKNSTTFLNPKKNKENTGTTAPKSPFDVDSSNKANNPFNLSPLHKELDVAYGNKPQATAAGNNNQGVEKSNVGNIADSLKIGSISYNTNTVSNKTTTAKPTIPPGLYGGKPKKDYSEELSKLKLDLPPVAASILNNSGTEIVVLDNMFSVDENGDVTPRIGRYYADKNKIYIDSWHVNKGTLLSETIHAVQDYLGMTGSGNSNLEFQEHVIKDLYYRNKYRKTKDIEYLNGISTTENNDYIYLINNAFDEKGVLDLNKFLPAINYYFNDFQSYYKKNDSYQTQSVKHFNYNWIKLLHIFDIEYKY